MVREFAVLATLAAYASAQGALEVARKAPPELHADAVIRLVQRGDLPASALDEALEAAKQAKEPVKLIASPDAPEGRPGIREAALLAGLDTLSLQMRVAGLIAEKDPEKARKLFDSIDHPELQMRPCQDPMLADDSAYFETAAKIGANFITVAGPGNSPGELAGIARLILANTGLSRDDFRMQVGALGLKMQMAAPDYRQYAISAEDLQNALEGLAARAKELAVPVDLLAEGARKLAVTQASAPHCHGELRSAVDFVDWFNHEFGKKFNSIEGAETVPLADLGSPVAAKYFASASGQALSEEFQDLRASRGKPEWNEQLAAFRKDFAEWKPEGEPIDVFHQKMLVLHGLYQVIPYGEERDKLAGEAVEFLKSGGIEREFPAEWEYQVRSFAESALNGRVKLLKEFRESGDPGLALFAALNP